MWAVCFLPLEFRAADVVINANCMFLQSFFNEFAGSSSADQVMLQERLAVSFDPFNQVFLAIF
jgi:hypothetical protein